MGVGKTAGPEGELALSRGAAKSGIIYTVRVGPIERLPGADFTRSQQHRHSPSLKS